MYEEKYKSKGQVDCKVVHIPDGISSETLDGIKYGNKNVNKDYYRWLDVAPDATVEQIRNKYRMMALLCHPDRSAFNGEISKEYKEKYLKINEAYDVLASRKNRFIYDMIGIKKSEFGILYGGLGKFVGDYLGISLVEKYIGRAKLYNRMLEIIEEFVMKSTMHYAEKKEDKTTPKEEVCKSIKNFSKEDNDKYLKKPRENLEELIKNYTNYFTNHDVSKLDHEDYMQLTKVAEETLRVIVRSEINGKCGILFPHIIQYMGKSLLAETDRLSHYIQNEEEPYVLRFIYNMSSDFSSSIQIYWLKMNMITKICFTVIGIIYGIMSMSWYSRKCSDSPETPPENEDVHHSDPMPTIEVFPAIHPSPGSFHSVSNYINATSSKPIYKPQKYNESESVIKKNAAESSQAMITSSLTSSINRFVNLIAHSCKYESVLVAEKLSKHILDGKSDSVQLRLLKSRALRIISEEYSNVDTSKIDLNLKI